MEIQFTTRVFKEGRTFVAHALELDVASCGGTKDRAVSSLKEAVRLFLEEAEKMGTLEQTLAEAGYTRRKATITSPKFVSVQRVSLPLPLPFAKVSPLPYKQLVKILEAEGFVWVRTEGDHMIFTKTGILRPVVVPEYAAVPVFIIKNNLKAAGISRDRYFQILGQ